MSACMFPALNYRSNEEDVWNTILLSGESHFDFGRPKYRNKLNENFKT